MKELEWDNPNKMHMESGFKTFDKQTNLITVGAAFCNTQCSMYIRPWNAVKNYSHIGKPGDFTKYDMQFFEDVPGRIREIIFDKNRTEAVILYEFFVWKNRCKEIIGHVLTGKNHNLIAEYVHCGCGENYSKRVAAIDECKKYICA